MTVAGIPGRLLDSLRAQLGGEQDWVVIATPDRPDVRFFAGVLHPVSLNPAETSGQEPNADPLVETARGEKGEGEEESDVDETEVIRSVLSKFSPSSLGLRFTLRKDEPEVTCDLAVEFTLFVPSWAPWTVVESLFSREEMLKRVPRTYKRLHISGDLGSFSLSRGSENPLDLSRQLSDGVGKLVSEGLTELGDLEPFPHFGSKRDDQLSTMPRDGPDWAELQQRLVSSLGSSDPPEWAPVIEVESRPSAKEDETLMLVSLTNRSREPRNLSDPRDACLYLPKVTLRLHGDEVAGILERASGENCALRKEGTSIETDVQPLEVQHRLRHPDRVPGTDLESLSSDTPRALREFIEYVRNRDALEEEIDGLEEGYRTLSESEQVRRAFEYAVEAFSMSHTHGPGREPFTHFRPFQLGFILTSLPDLVRREHGEVPRVHTLAFSTGEGKTEAYFVLCLISAFLDRLEGKGFGVSAWLMYPLRMLSFQQLDRLVQLCYRAEKVRKTRLGDDGEPFRVGLFVGRSHSPNQIRHARELLAAKEGEWTLVGSCPECSSDVRSSFDEQSWRIVHNCTNEECALSNEPLPLLVTDDEAYRFQPAFLLGTVDKITLLGKNPRLLRMLLGSPLRCRIHGAAVRGLHAWRDDVSSPPLRCDGRLPPSKPGQGRLNPCGRKLVEVEFDRERHPPRILVLDEAHLLEEDAGDFFAHYAAALHNSLELHGARIPVAIAASATIWSAKSHLAALWCTEPENVYVFPDPGYEPGANPYFEMTGEIERVITCLRPFGKTLIDATVHTLAALQIAITAMGGEPEQGAYSMHTVYILAKREGDTIYGSAEGQLQEILKDRGHAGALDRNRIWSIRRETDMADIVKFIEAADGDDPAIRPQLVIATATIGHGVDVQNLNVLILVGLPRRFSEYIQVLGRSGRKKPALVVVIAHPLKDRDTRFHSFFHEFHSNPEIMESEVPINPLAPGVTYYTVPGVMASVLYSDERNLAGMELDSPGNFKRLYGSPSKVDGLISAVEGVLSRVRNIRNDRPIWPGEDFKNRVRKRCRGVWRRAARTPTPTRGRGTFWAVGSQTMMSLRSTDREVKLTLYRPYLGLTVSGEATLRRSLVQSIYRTAPGALPYFGPGGVPCTPPGVGWIIPTGTGQFSEDITTAVAYRMYREVHPDDLFALDAEGSPKRLAGSLRLVEPQEYRVVPFPRYLVCPSCRLVVSDDDAAANKKTCPECSRGLAALRLVQVHECGTIHDVPRDVRNHRYDDGHRVRLYLESERNPYSASWTCSCKEGTIAPWPENCPLCRVSGLI